MANRPIFEVLLKKPFYAEKNIEFQFFPGFSKTQKQKCIDSFHNKYLEENPEKKILEISSKSKNELGIYLSSFNLVSNNYYEDVSVEVVFQSSKYFENGGPYEDILTKTSRDAKRDDRLTDSGKLLGFRCKDNEFPLFPKTYFYDWLYLNAISEIGELQDELLKFDSFTDIEFNPNRSINCQAKSAAVFVSLKRMGLISEALSSKEKFLDIIY